MKTLILVAVGGEIYSLEPSDFPFGAPVEGRNYDFDGKLYTIVEITETLGVRSALGNKLTANERLLKFAELVSNGDEALKLAIMKPKKIGADGPEDVRSSGGIIIGTAESSKPGLAESIDHILFVKTVPAGSRRSRLPRGADSLLPSLKVDDRQASGSSGVDELVQPDSGLAEFHVG